VTEVPPHFVKQVNDLVDRNFVRHDQPGYRNPKIVPGDRILQIDGRDAEHAPLDALHKMLKGPLHSTVLLSLARKDTGERYLVEALRHGKYAFDGPNGGLYDPPPMSDLLKDAISQRSASIYSASIYSSQRSDRSAQSAVDVYNTHRTQDRRTASDLYASQRSVGSGRATPVGTGTTGRASSPTGFPAPTEPRVLTPRGGSHGVVSSTIAPSMRFE